MTSTIRQTLLRSGTISLWSALLFLPFKGLQAAGILFILLFLALLLITLTSRLSSHVVSRADIVQKQVAQLIPSNSLYLLLLVLPALTMPLISRNYMLDVAVLSGVYIILGLALNVVVGFTGLGSNPVLGTRSPGYVLGDGLCENPLGRMRHNQRPTAHHRLGNTMRLVKPDVIELAIVRDVSGESLILLSSLSFLC